MESELGAGSTLEGGRSVVWKSRGQENDASAQAEGLAKESSDGAERKRVIRFTKEQLLALRKPTRLPPELEKTIPNIISLECLDPVNAEHLDYDESNRAWTRLRAAGRGRGKGLPANGPSAAPPGGMVGGGGRGGVRGGWGPGDGADGYRPRWERGGERRGPLGRFTEEREGYWSRDRGGPKREDPDLWDDVTNGGNSGDANDSGQGRNGGDWGLEDMADSTLKFEEEKEAFLMAQRKANAEGAEAAALIAAPKDQALNIEEESDQLNADTFGENAQRPDDNGMGGIDIKGLSLQSEAGVEEMSQANGDEGQTVTKLAGLFAGGSAGGFGGPVSDTKVQVQVLGPTGEPQPRQEATATQSPPAAAPAAAPAPVLASVPNPPPIISASPIFAMLGSGQGHAPLKQLEGAVVQAAQAAQDVQAQGGAASAYMKVEVSSQVWSSPKQQLPQQPPLQQPRSPVQNPSSMDHLQRLLAQPVPLAQQQQHQQQQHQQQQQQQQQQRQHQSGTFLQQSPVLSALSGLALPSGLAHHQQQQQQQQQQPHQQQHQQSHQQSNQQPARVEDVWYYRDPQGNTQGPFKTAEMRQWHDAGYFKSHLPMRFGEHGEFRPLVTLYPSLQEAFLRPPQIGAGFYGTHVGRLQTQQQHQQQHQQFVRQQGRGAVAGVFAGQADSQHWTPTSILADQQQRVTTQQILEAQQRQQLLEAQQRDQQRLRQLQQQQQQQQQQQHQEDARRHQALAHMRLLEQQRLAAAEVEERRRRLQEDALMKREAEERAAREAAARLHQQQEEEARVRQHAEDEMRLRQQRLLQAEEERRQQQLRLYAEEEARRHQQLRQQAEEEARRRQAEEEELKMMGRAKQETDERGRAHEALRLQQQQQAQQQQQQDGEDGGFAEAAEEGGSEQQHQQQQSAPIAPWVAAKVTPQKTLLEVQDEEQRRKQAAEALAATQTQEAAGPAWKGAAPPAMAQSLSDIQREEQKQREMVQAQAQNMSPPAAPPVTRSSSGGWSGAPLNPTTLEKRPSLTDIQQEEQQKHRPQSGRLGEGAAAPTTGIKAEVPVSVLPGKLSQREKKALLAEQQAQAAARVQQPAWSTARPPQPQLGAGLSLTEIQAEEEKQRRMQHQQAESSLKAMLGLGAMRGGATAAVPGPRPVGPGGAWQTAQAKASAPKSLLEIQQEEAARRAAQQTQQVSSASGWAAMAASGVTPTPVLRQQVVTGVRPAWGMQQPRPAPSPRAASAAAEGSFWGGAQQAGKPPQQQQSQGRQLNAGGLPPEIAVWVAAEMKKITGNEYDDLSALGWCFGDDVEPATVRETLNQMLGPSPQTINFASAFINKRGEWRKQHGRRR